MGIQAFLGGDSRVRSKGQDHQGVAGGATLKIPTTLSGLEEASCGVEAIGRVGLQGFDSPSPHQFAASLSLQVTTRNFSFRIGEHASLRRLGSCPLFVSGFVLGRVVKKMCGAK